MNRISQEQSGVSPDDVLGLRGGKSFQFDSNNHSDIGTMDQGFFAVLATEAFEGSSLKNHGSVGSRSAMNVADAGRATGIWLSILVPVYNVQLYVEECLWSILDQIADDRGIELILLDDQSTDRSFEICRNIAARTDANANIKLISHPDNRGLSAARNSLLDAAKGRYLWFIDSDDALMPGAIARLREIVDCSPVDIIMCDYTRNDGKPFSTFAGPDNQLIECTETLIAGVFSKRRLHAWSRIWKRDLFDLSIRFPEGAVFEDVATVPWLMLAARTCYYAAEPWIFYRSRPGSIMGSMKAPEHFDRQRGDDMAIALNGFSHALARTIPNISPQTLDMIGRFLSREFVKIVKRIARGRRQYPSFASMRAEMGRYRNLMEEQSPTPFRAIALDYARRGRFARSATLGLALALSGSDISTSNGAIVEKSAAI